MPAPDSVYWKMLDLTDPDKIGVGMKTYIKAVDPSNIGALAGIAGGVGLMGSAVDPDKDRSVSSRAIRAAGGLGLLAGGTYLAANAKARAAFRNAVLSALGKARVGVAKTLGV